MTESKPKYLTILSWPHTIDLHEAYNGGKTEQTIVVLEV